MNKIKIPKILQIKGVHPQDCITFGSIFDVTTQVNINNKDEIPTIFQDKYNWIKSTNTKCLNCTLEFDSIPIPCPINLQRKKNNEMLFTLRKNKHNKVILFCSFECLINHVFEVIYNESDRILTLKMIELLAINFGINSKNIKRGLSREDLDIYGGNFNVKKFKNQITSIY
jgi:hypothetical protein